MGEVQTAPVDPSLIVLAACQRRTGGSCYDTEGGWGEGDSGERSVQAGAALSVPHGSLCTRSFTVPRKIVQLRLNRLVYPATRTEEFLQHDLLPKEMHMTPKAISRIPEETMDQRYRRIVANKRDAMRAWTKSEVFRSPRATAESFANGRYCLPC